MSAVDDVYAFLDTAGIAGASTDWDLVRRRMMDVPLRDTLVVVSEDGGVQPEFPAAEGIGDSAMQDPGVLVTVRAAAWDSDASKAKALEVLQALHGVRDTQVGATTYFRVRALTPEPIFAGYDDQHRPLHTVGFRLLAALT